MSLSSEKDSHLAHLRNLCSNHYDSSHELYSAKSLPSSLYANLNPSLVLEPDSLPVLQEIMKHIYPLKDLNFGVRNTGTGGSSARDVLISMHNFKSFSYDQETETAIVGAGFSWGEVDREMERASEGRMAVVGARCTWVGVTGSAIVGGLSWLSHEWGLISDPQNLLDVQIVLWDGRVVWAGQEEMEDLLWGCRGGGGGLGVITALKMKAHPVPPKVFAAVVRIPYSSLHETSAAISAMASRPSDPKLAMHITNQGAGMGQSDQGARPGIVILPVDLRGEAHARSSEGFDWIWKIPGAEEFVAGEMGYAAVNALADTFKEDYQGKNNFWLSAPLLDGIDEQLLVRAWEWYEECYTREKGFGRGSQVLLEFMQEKAFGSSESRSATAWPHSGWKHVMQLVLGCRPEDAKPTLKEIVMEQFAKAGKMIGREKFTGEYHAGFLHPFNDLEEVYGENWERLLEVRRKYDPLGRFDSVIDIASGKVVWREDREVVLP